MPEWKENVREKTRRYWAKKKGTASRRDIKQMKKDACERKRRERARKKHLKAMEVEITQQLGTVIFE